MFMMSMGFSTEIANFTTPSQASDTSVGRKLIYLRKEFNRYSSITSKTWIGGISRFIERRILFLHMLFEYILGSY